MHDIPWCPCNVQRHPMKDANNSLINEYVFAIQSRSSKIPMEIFNSVDSSMQRASS